MAHLQLVSTDGRQVPPPAPAQRIHARVLHLPRLGLADYAAAIARQDEAGALMHRTARIDARRLVRNLRARHPIADVRGMCVWNLVGDLLCHVIPVAGSEHEVWEAADALRIVVRLVLDAEALGAGMMVGGVLLSVHGEGRDGHAEIALGLTTDGCTVEMRFGLRDGTFVGLP